MRLALVGYSVEGVCMGGVGYADLTWGGGLNF